MRASILLLASVLAIGCAPKRMSTTPSAADLLPRVEAAAAHAGPATISVSTFIKRPKRADIKADETFQWQDATHYVDAAIMDGVKTVATADGKAEYVLTPAKNEYTVGDAGDSAPQALSNLMDVLRSARSRPEAVSKAVVTAAVENGVPVYNVRWPDIPRGLVAPAEEATVTLTVRQSDSLPICLSFTNNKGLSSVSTLKWTKASGAFPSNTFRFRAPAGAKRVGPDFAALCASWKGKTAPNITLPALKGGQPVSLSSLRGKTVLLDLWATWCPPCRASLPVVNDASVAFSGKGLVVMAVNDQETAAKVEPFVRRHGLSLPVYLDKSGSVRKAFGVQGIPTSVLIGPDGKVLNYEVGFRSEDAFWKRLDEAGFRK